MDINELILRSNKIRESYHALELKNHSEKWTIEEDLLALSNDIGNLNRLVMTKFNRYYDETPYILEQKLAENIWWLIELSSRLDVNIESELRIFLEEKEKLLDFKNNSCTG